MIFSAPYYSVMNLHVRQVQIFILLQLRRYSGDADYSLDDLAKRIEESTGIGKTRATILGHVQRGGSPSVEDRVNAITG